MFMLPSLPYLTVRDFIFPIFGFGMFDANEIVSNMSPIGNEFNRNLQTRSLSLGSAQCREISVLREARGRSPTRY